MFVNQPDQNIRYKIRLVVEFAVRRVSEVLFSHEKCDYLAAVNYVLTAKIEQQKSYFPIATLTFSSLLSSQVFVCIHCGLF